jgi:hypothetical protein
MWPTAAAAPEFVWRRDLAIGPKEIDMKRFLAGRRFLPTAALLALVAVPAMLLGPRNARAFTLVPNVIYFDPISVPAGHTLHVHLANAWGTGSMGFHPVVKPTTPAAGTQVVGTFVSLNVGAGSDQAFPFAAFSPPPGAKSVPVVALILVTATATSTLPADWSGRVASSVEVVNDLTGEQVAILGGRHIIVTQIVGNTHPCESCN